MKEGAWVALFLGPLGSGGLMLSLNAGVIEGKTDSHRYSGTYTVRGCDFFATMAVHRLFRLARAFAGIEGDFELEIVGSFAQNATIIDTVGFVDGNGDKRIQIVLSNIGCHSGPTD
jgi:hypothetical protein